MKSEFFDVDRRHEVDVQHLKRYARREAWTMTQQDFAVETVLLFCPGANVDTNGTWVVLNSVVCHRRPPAAADGLEARAIEGWVRLRLPDGHSLVNVSPLGRTFIDGGNRFDNEVDLTGLANLLAADAERHAPISGAHA